MRDDVRKALYTFISRKRGFEEPAGKRDRKGCWYPRRREKRRCCRLLRRPSPEDRDLLRRHCFTIEHIANLYGVPPALVSNAAIRAGSERILDEADPR